MLRRRSLFRSRRLFLCLMRIFIILTFVFFSVPLICNAQMKPETSSNKSFVKSSAAYAEVLLRRTELEADLEELLVAYTREFPAVKETQLQIDLLNAELMKLFATKIEEKEKLTLALGKLIIRKVELENDLSNLKRQYGDEHPSVKKAQRKVLVFESAIKDILL